MKKTFLYFLSVIFTLTAALYGCQKPEDGEENKGGEGDKPALENFSINLEYQSSTATTALFSYTVQTGSLSSAPVEIFMRYSLSESLIGDDVKTVKLQRDGGQLCLEGLVFDRQYYYETFVDLYGTEYNKVRGNFSTSSLELIVEEPQVAFSGIVFNGRLAGFGEADRSEIGAKLILTEGVGFEQEYDIALEDDGTFELSVEGLDLVSEYQYRAVISQGNLKSVESDPKTFLTLDPYVGAVKEFSSATDLSAGGTANSYIVSRSGNYKFKTVKGNSSVSAGNVSSVRILWESFGTSVSPTPTELISSTGYKDGYAYIEVPASFKEGNAVVAAYDKDDRILWSWHIWLVEDPIVEITYANNAGVMMDRNLGALSAEVNSPEALGLFYQWGRKDPFLGSSSISEPVYAVSTRHLKLTLNTEETSNVAFAIANPHKFVLANASSDWLSAKDNTLWSADKTIYDPCPAGWRVPDGGYNGGLGESAFPDGIWAKAGFSRQGITPFSPGDKGKLGKVFSAPFCTPDTWYPVAGSIHNTTGSLGSIAVDGIYFSVTAFTGTDSFATGLLINYLENLNGHYIYCGGEKLARAAGASVRCCKE